MLKRFITLLFCLFLIFVSIPFLGSANFFNAFVYADSAPNGYVSANTDQDLTESFNDYCKSRNAEFTAQLPSAMRTYIYNLMVKGAYSLEEDLDTIQSSLFKKSTSDGKWSWYLNSTVMNFYNRLFDFLLGENELEVGDTGEETVFSGEYFTDVDGYTCLVYVIGNTSSNYPVYTQGTPYKYTGEKVASMYDNGTTSINFHINQNVNYTSNLSKGYYRNLAYLYTKYNSTSKNMYWGINGDPDTGDRTQNPAQWIIYKIGNYYYLGYMYTTLYSNGTTRRDIQELINLNVNTENTTINFTYNNINNNVFEGDTIITNEGDVITNEGDTTINYNPYPDGGGTSTPPSSGNGGGGTDGTINFPDIDIDLPEIDWSLGDLSHKFPFSIPFDMVSLVNVLDAEPEAPRFQGTLDFSFTTWDYDIDLSEFDSVASVCRTVELLLFVFGLILITRSLIKG